MTISAVSASDVDSPQDSGELDRANFLAALIAVVVFSALSIYESFRSPGFLEADSCTHYLYARFALREPHYLVNVWGRPLVTGLYAIPAHLAGRFGVHLTALALALICAAAAYAIAAGQRYRWPALAVIFTLAQPLVFLHSFSELTELPFAATIALAFLAYQRRQFLLMTVLVAVSPLARPEGFGFILLATVALVMHRRWWWLFVLPIPLLLWDYVGWLVFGRPVYPEAQHLPAALAWVPWLKQVWPYAPESLYGRGSILQYVWFLPAVVSPLILPATLLGIWRCFSAREDEAPAEPRMARQRRLCRSLALPSPVRGFILDHRARCEQLIAVIPLLILVGHSLLHWLGKMASSGEVRYMIVVAPFWGLLAARGWEWAWRHFDWKWPLRIAAIATLLPVVVNQKPYVFGQVWGYRVLPMEYTDDMLHAKRVADWYRAWPLRAEYPAVLTGHTGIHFFLDISPTEQDERRQWTKQAVASTPSGTVVIWDPMFGYYNSDLTRSVTAAEVNTVGWVLDLAATRFVDELSDDAMPDDKNWSIWLSPRTADERQTAANATVPGLADKARDAR